MAAKKSLPKPELDLPKPNTDLPLPQKDLPTEEEENIVPPPKEMAPSNAVPEAKHSRFGLFLKLFLLFVVLALIFSSGYVLLQNNSTSTIPSPTPAPQITVELPTLTASEAATWKTYQDTNGYFNLKYPPTWNVSYSPSNNVEGKQDINLKGPDGEMLIWWVDTYGGGCSDPYYWSTVYLGTGKVNACFSKDMREVSQIWKIMDEKTHLGFYINAKTYPKTQDSEQTLIKILSTFKFIDQTSQIDTSTWKTYAGNKYTFKYPSEWNITNAFYQATDAANLESGILDYSYKGEEEYANADSIKEISVNGSKAIKISGYTGIAGAVYYLITYINIENQTFYLKASTLGNTDDENKRIEEIYNKILSTLKLTL